MVELREHERKTLSALQKLGGKAPLEQIAGAAGLSDSAVMRAALTLQERKMIETSEKKHTVSQLTQEGRTYARIGLPERRLIVALKKLDNRASLDEVAGKAGLDKQFVPIALGWVLRKKWATFDPKTKTLQILDDHPQGNDEKLLKLLDEKEALSDEELDPELREAIQVLKGRKLLQVEQKTSRIVALTDTGREATKKGLKVAAEITQLTPVNHQRQVAES